MTEAQQKTAFRVFRPHEEEKDQDMTSGVGLGLSNSKFLVESSGGSISLRSAFGEYTNVIFKVDAPVTRNSEIAESVGELNPEDLRVSNVSI